MHRGKSLVAVLAMFAASQVAAQNLVNPSKPGDVFIDHHGSTVQLTACQGSGPTTECRVRVLKQAAGGSTYGTIWWTLDNLRDSERVGVRGGIAPYSGPAVPLPSAAAAPAQTAQAAPPATRPTAPAPRPAAPAQQGATNQAGAANPPAATGERCTPGTPYTGARPASLPPSEALFKEIIANKFTVDGNQRYPRKVDYQSFTVSKPITNSVGITNQGANRITNGAPAGAQLYPIKTSFSVCKAEWTKQGQYDSTYFCWRAGQEWACGVSESRVN